VDGGAVIEEVLFSKVLETRSKTLNFFATVSDFFKKMVILGKS
jgi:hypothetical protein